MHVHMMWLVSQREKTPSRATTNRLSTMLEKVSILYKLAKAAV